jgi:hypothetical protein
MSGAGISGRLWEIVFSDGRFWLTVMISVTVCLFPLMFYFQTNSLLFPSLKDLILQKALDPEQVVEEADPKKVKATMDMFKQ